MSSACLETLAMNSDNAVSVLGLANEPAGGTLITDAIVTVTLTDKGTGQEVPGITWPITALQGNPGDYHAIIDKAAQLVEGMVYIAKVTAVSGGIDRQWSLRALAQMDYGG